MESTQPASRNPWAWIPSLYFAQGIPYVMAMTVSVVMYKRLGISNADIALYTSWLYLPWVLKPLWSPFIDMFKTKRFWVIIMQFLIGAALACVALTIPASSFFQYTIAIFWLMAFSSATHDIAADGFYMLALKPDQQAAYVGVRSTFYRVATIFCQGVLVVIAGQFEQQYDIKTAWSITFYISAGIFIALFIYHRFMLPHPVSDKGTYQKGSQGVMSEFFKTFVLYFKKKDIGIILLFLLFYRFAEAQLVKLVAPFLLDARDKGGLGLSTSEVGIAYGTVGVICLLAGGILGGIAISRKGLRWWLWPMVIIMHTPDLMFVFLSQVQPVHFLTICAAVGIEQFGYGFGFTAYMMYMIMVAEGEHKTAHYAICTGFMALGMMLPGMFSGWLQEMVGYKYFFFWVMLSTIPGFIVAALVKIDPSFAKKGEEPKQ
ncbi:MAG: AmpG family muropeptide MFS transporter [bacterium]